MENNQSFVVFAIKEVATIRRSYIREWKKSIGKNIIEYEFIWESGTILISSDSLVTEFSLSCNDPFNS